MTPSPTIRSTIKALVVELVDAADSKSASERSGGSSPSKGTSTGTASAPRSCDTAARAIPRGRKGR